MVTKFGDELVTKFVTKFAPKFITKFGDSPNAPPKIWQITKFGDEFVTKCVTKYLRNLPRDITPSDAEVDAREIYRL